MKRIAILLLLVTLAAADDKLIEQLLHADEAKRVDARVRILRSEADVLARLLDRNVKRWKRAEHVLQIYTVRGVRGEDAAWALQNG
jgi:hypothetical protein